MRDLVTLVIPLRNRESSRVGRLIKSLRENGGDPHIIVVDYGSRPEFSRAYAEAAQELEFELEIMHSRGLPWNKCRAINRGVRMASTSVICTADVDIAFVSNPISACLEMGTKGRMFHIPSYWLRRDGIPAHAEPAGKGTPGMFQLLDRRSFEDAGGYDERIVYWGLEDLDWPDRLKSLGYEETWLPEPHRIYHQWHEASESGGLRPESASYNTIAACMENKLNPRLTQSWGEPLRRADRPILERMEDSGTCEQLTFAKNALMHFGQLEIIAATKAPGRLVKLDLGARMARRPLSRFREQAKSLMRPLAALTGSSVVTKMNVNFDYLYAMLPALANQGLLDYFIADDFSFVYLLWS